MAEALIRHIAPSDIERRSMEIISGTLADRGINLDPEHAPIIKRVIHTSADFDYAESLCFSDHAVSLMRQALLKGADIVTDTEMAKAGINKKMLAEFGGEVHCFMNSPEVAAEAKARGITRAAVSMERAAQIRKPCLFAVGNAPTALIRLYELLSGESLIGESLIGKSLIREGSSESSHEAAAAKGSGFHPAGIIAVPVGFVNVVEAKELILALPVPHIVARGRKGGSNVAAAICNALLYGIS